MRYLKVLTAALLVPALCPAQTVVDRVAQELDSLSTVAFNDWKVSPDLKARGAVAGDPTAPGFDDSRWETLTLRQWISPDSCWIRKEIVLPPAMLGRPVTGPLRFLVTVDDYGYLWVNGQAKGRFDWDGEFELTRDAHPGQRFTIAIKAINTGGPLRLLRAELAMESARQTQDLARDIALSFRVGQKLLGVDTYQTNANAKVDPGIDRSTTDRSEKERLMLLLQRLAGRIATDALRTGDPARFAASIEAVRTELGPIRDFVHRYTLFLDANAHIDAAWLWRAKETIQVCRNTFASVFNIMAQRPDFTYTQSAAAYYVWMQELYPDIFRKMQEAVRSGRWEIVGGMWVEPDCNLPGGESWYHHLLYAKEYFRRNFDTDVRIGWNPDSFGYNANMPMFYRNAGITAFVTQKIGWNETNVFPYRVFWWESPDGSRILSYFPFDYVNTIENPYQLVDWMRQFDANTGFRKMMVLFGVGDHGGGPSLEMLQRIDRLRGLDLYPSIEYGTTAQYLAWLSAQDLARLPVWKDELYLEYHQGTFTTQAAMKKANRTEETLLGNAEKFSSIASLSGRPYNGTDLAAAWKELLFLQFHDILPGSSIREVYIDAAEGHGRVKDIGAHELAGALDHIARQINTSRVRAGSPLVVFNPLSWERSDLVRFSLPEGSTEPYAVFDLQGRELPSLTLVTGKYSREILFVAPAVPALGYATFALRRQQPSARPTVGSATAWGAEDERFAFTIDRQTGWISSLRDKRTGHELLAGPGNELQLLEDIPKEYDAWNIGWTGRVFPSTFRSAELLEHGPLRTVVRLHRDYLRPGVRKGFPTEDFPSSFFTQDIILYHGLDRIEFVTDVDWWEEHTMLKVAFPLACADSVATYEIPYGTIRRSTQLRTSWEQARVEVPAERWADLSSDAFGVSLLNEAKYGYDIKGHTVRLSLLRSPKSPDPTADRGKHTIRYALYPHAGRWDAAATLQRGYEFNVPLIPVATGSHTGALPASLSFAALAPGNLVLTTVKKAEHSDAWIFQWYNAQGVDTRAILTLPRVPRKVLRSSFLEEDGAPIGWQGTRVEVPTGKSSTVTLKILF